MIILNSIGAFFGLQFDRESTTRHKRQHRHLSKLSRRDPLTAPTIPVNPNWQVVLTSNRKFARYVELVQKNLPRRAITGLPMLDPLGVVATTWGYWITFVDLTFTAFFVPLSLAFNYSMNNLTLSIMDMIGNVMYILDMIFNFHVGFIARSGLETVVILDGPTAAKQYIKHGSFMVDVLATVPAILQIILYAVLFNDESNEALRTVINFMKLLRLARVMNLILRMGRFDRGGQVAVLAASRLNALTLLGVNAAFSLIVCINVLACFWWWIAEIEGLSESWVAYVDKPLISLMGDTYDASSIAKRWTVCAYFVMVSMSTIGYGDITPQTIAEMYIAFIIVLLGVAWFAYLISIIATVIRSRKRDVDQDVIIGKMQIMEVWMKRYEFPLQLKRKIRRHILSSWTPTPNFTEDAQIYDHLPLHLKLEAAKQMLRSDAQFAFLGSEEAVKDISPEKIDIFEKALAQFSSLEGAESGTTLYTVGDAASFCTLLQEGTLAVSVPETRAPVLVSAPALLGVGALFGGSMVVPQCRKRHTTVTVFHPATFWKINAVSLEQVLILKAPEVLLGILQHYRLQVVEAADRLKSFQYRSATRTILNELSQMLSGLSELEADLKDTVAALNQEEDNQSEIPQGDQGESERSATSPMGDVLDGLEQGRISSAVEKRESSKLDDERPQEGNGTAPVSSSTAQISSFETSTRTMDRTRIEVSDGSRALRSQLKDVNRSIASSSRTSLNDHMLEMAGSHLQSYVIGKTASATLVTVIDNNIAFVV